MTRITNTDDNGGNTDAESEITPIRTITADDIIYDHIEDYPRPPRQRHELYLSNLDPIINADLVFKDLLPAQIQPLVKTVYQDIFPEHLRVSFNGDFDLGDQTVNSALFDKVVQTGFSASDDGNGPFRLSVALLAEHSSEPFERLLHQLHQTKQWPDGTTATLAFDPEKLEDL